MNPAPGPSYIKTEHILYQLDLLVYELDYEPVYLLEYELNMNLYIYLNMNLI